MPRRRRQHFVALRAGTHFNEHLQRAFIKYGEDSFQFEELCSCAVCHLPSVEATFIAGDSTAYNVREETGTSHRHSAETRRKMSQTRTGRKYSAAHCQAISAGQQGKKLSAAHRQKLSEVQKGRKLSDAHKQNISAGLRSHHENSAKA
jgi:hypothetical protein